jgi:hypothetical protein
LSQDPMWEMASLRQEITASKHAFTLAYLPKRG